VASSRAARLRALSGSIVADETKTAPSGMVCAAPSGPKRMASVCAAFTTTETTTAAFRAASAGVDAPRPPSATKRSTAVSLTSHPVTSNPARLSDWATPKPMEPRPITAARVAVASTRISFWSA